jgi:hypothetical protein
MTVHTGAEGDVLKRYRAQPNYRAGGAALFERDEHGAEDVIALCSVRDDAVRIADALNAAEGAVGALEQITDPECMTRGTDGWIDTDAPARIAQNALDALGGQS